MSPDKSPEINQRHTEIRDFIFPNEYPPELVQKEIGLILAHRFVDPEFSVDSNHNMGTIWPIEFSYADRKPRKEIDEMDLEELELELLVKERLPEEF